MGDGIVAYKHLHSLEVCLGVDRIGVGGCVVCLGLLQFLQSGAALGGVKHGALLLRGSPGPRDLLRTIAALQPMEVSLDLLKLCLGLRALGLQVIGFEVHQQNPGLYCLALLDENLSHAAADLRTDLDFSSFYGAGVDEGVFRICTGMDEPSSEEEYGECGDPRNDSAFHAIPSRPSFRRALMLVSSQLPGSSSRISHSSMVAM